MPLHPLKLIKGLDFKLLLHKEAAITVIVLAALLSVIIVALLQLSKVREFIMKVINDTLKKTDAIDGIRRYNKGSLTMLTAWLAVEGSYVFDMIKNGFNSYTFSIMVGVALGAKVTESLYKKINPDKPQTPSNETQQPIQ